jgi:hypothetical protein
MKTIKGLPQKIKILHWLLENAIQYCSNCDTMPTNMVYIETGYFNKHRVYSKLKFLYNIFILNL